jgi:hypothetical protein
MAAHPSHRDHSRRNLSALRIHQRDLRAVPVEMTGGRIGQQAHLQGRERRALRSPFAIERSQGFHREVASRAKAKDLPGQPSETLHRGRSAALGTFQVRLGRMGLTLPVMQRDRRGRVSRLLRVEAQPDARRPAGDNQSREAPTQVPNQLGDRLEANALRNFADPGRMDPFLAQVLAQVLAAQALAGPDSTRLDSARQGRRVRRKVNDRRPPPAPCGSHRWSGRCG